MIETILSLSLFISQPIKVAVVDTGLAADLDYPVNLCSGGHVDFTQDGLYVNDVPLDIEGHGTAMTGAIHQYATNTIVGEDKKRELTTKHYSVIDDLREGVDANYCIVVIKAIAKNGRVAYSSFLRALDYVYVNNFDIVNLSLGGYTHTEAEKDIIKRIIDDGAVVVAAVGNDNRNLSLTPFYPAMSDDRVISVGSYYDGQENNFQPIFSTEKEKDVIYLGEEHYSNKYGKTSISNYGPQVDVWMPGWRVITNGIDGIYASSGTSISAAAYTGYLVRKMIEERKNYNKFVKGGQ